MAAVRDELSTINGEVFASLPLDKNQTQYTNSQVQLSDRARLPYIQAVLFVIFNLFSLTSVLIVCDFLNAPKGTSRDCTFGLCPPHSTTSQDHRTNPGQTFTFHTVWNLDGSFSSGWKTCAADR